MTKKTGEKVRRQLIKQNLMKDEVLTKYKALIN